MKKFFTQAILSLTLILSPVMGMKVAHVNAAGLVPDCGVTKSETSSTGKEKTSVGTPCGFNDFMQLINNVINFLLFVIATPLVAIIFCYAGFLLLTSGGSAERMTKVKSIFFNVVIGYIIALIAWLLVKTILVTVGFDPKDAFLIEF